MANATDYGQLVPLVEGYLWPLLQTGEVSLRPIDHVSRLMRQTAGSVPILFKVLPKNTDGDLAAFVSANNVPRFGPPPHVRHSLDEFFCVLEGDFAFLVGTEQTRLRSGDTILISRNVPHAPDCVSIRPRKLLVTMPPVHRMDDFFWQLAQLLPATDSPDPAAI